MKGKNNVHNQVALRSAGVACRLADTATLHQAEGLGHLNAHCLRKLRDTQLDEAFAQATVKEWVKATPLVPGQSPEHPTPERVAPLLAMLLKPSGMPNTPLVNMQKC